MNFSYIETHIKHSVILALLLMTIACSTKGNSKTNGDADVLPPAAGAELHNLDIYKEENSRFGGVDLSPQRSVLLGDWLYFFANDSSADWQLLRSNGGPAEVVMDIYADSNLVDLVDFGSVLPPVPVPYNESVVFRTVGQDGNAILWRTDLSITEPIMKTVSEYGRGQLSPAIVHQGRLYFSVSDSSGNGLWSSDGTAADTRLEILYPEGIPFDPFFDGNDELYLLESGKGGANLFAFNGDSLVVVTDQEGEEVLGFSLSLLRKTTNGIYLTGRLKSTGLRDLYHLQKNRLSLLDTDVFSQTLVTFNKWQYYVGTSLMRTNGAVIEPVLGPNNREITATAKTIFHELGGKLYFIAGGALWRIDEVGASSLFSGVRNSTLALVNQRLYFQDANQGLGTSDGNVHEWIPDTQSARTSNPQQPLLIAVADQVYFLKDGVLWFAKGTAASPVEFVDPPSELTLLAGAGEWLYFHAWNEYFVPDLWRAKVDAQGKTTIEQLTGSATQAKAWAQGEYLAVGKTMFFMDTSEYSGGSRMLWAVQDNVGSVLVRGLEESTPFFGSEPRDFTAFGDRVYFSAKNINGRELWSTDGTEEGTRMLADIASGTASSSPHNLTVFDDQLYFWTEGDEDGLWRTDGAKVSQVEETKGMRSTDMVAYRDQLYFVGSDAEEMTALWRVEPAEPPKRLLTFTSGSGTTHKFNDELFVLNSDGLWHTNGTLEGGGLLTRGDVSPRLFQELNGWVYFLKDLAADDPGYVSQSTLWRTNGTIEQTERVDLSSTQSSLVNTWRGQEALNGWLYFVTTNDNLVEFWRTDGATAELVPGLETSKLEDAVDGNLLGVLDGWLYLSVQNQNEQTKLWRVNGSIAEQLDLPANTRWFFAGTLFANQLYLSGRLVGAGIELWRLSGRKAEFINLNPSGSSNPSDFAVVGQRLFFSATDRVHGEEVWFVD